MNDKGKMYSLKKDLVPIAKFGTIFHLRDGYFINENESISIKATDNSAKIFKHESRR